MIDRKKRDKVTEKGHQQKTRREKENKRSERTPRKPKKKLIYLCFSYRMMTVAVLMIPVVSTSTQQRSPPVAMPDDEGFHL